MYFPTEEVASVSAGTGAMDGYDMVPEVWQRLKPQGQAPGPHNARQLTNHIIDAADLILGMTKEHRSYVVRMVPSAVRKTFTLREAARLIMAAPELPNPSSPTEAVTLLPELLRATRAQSVGNFQDDVADPYRQGDEAFDLMLTEMNPSLAVIVRFCIGKLAR